MKIVVGAVHPKHVHIFRNFAKEMNKKGHEVVAVAVNKGETRYLLDKYYDDYIVLGNSGGNIYSKLLKLAKFEGMSLAILKKLRPDVIMGRPIPHLVHASAFLGKKYVILEDTEIAKRLHKITVPFSKYVVTPENYIGDFGKKHVRFNGIFELAYLHPNYFKPTKKVFDYLDFPKNEKFVVLRTISWNAYHDIGLKGLEDHREVIKRLSDLANVVVLSENGNKFLRDYQVKIPPELAHSLLYFADLYIGEGATMAVEAAVLGTPSIHIESFSGIPTGLKSGNLRELRDKYRLLEFYANQSEALQKATQILENENSKKFWNKRREKFIRDKIDVTRWLVDFTENTVQLS